jgi:hypothetical protein
LEVGTWFPEKVEDLGASRWGDRGFSVGFPGPPATWAPYPSIVANEWLDAGRTPGERLGECAAEQRESERNLLWEIMRSSLAWSSLFGKT